MAKAQATLDTSEAVAKSSNIDVPISSVDTSSQLKFTSSDIKSAEAAIEAAEKQAAAAHAHVLEAQAENVKTQDDVTRYRLLLAKEEVPKQVYDHAYAAAATDIAAVAAAEADEAAAQQAVQEAHSRLTEAEAHYEDAQAGPQRVASTRAKALSAMADVHQKRAAVEQAQLNLRYTSIFAPVTGEVTKKVVVGLNVEPGEQLLTVVPLDQVWITANFKETQLKRMRVGQKAKIDLDSNGRTYRGHVDSIAGSNGADLQLAAARKRNRQLRENRSAGTGKDRSGAGRKPGPPASAGHECRSESVFAMSATALALPSEQAVWRPKVNPWAIAATVSMAAFIEVLDTSVANVALPYIAGGLGASYDDSTWVLTSYLAANAIVLTHQRMARGVDRPQAIFHDVAGHFHGEFTALRVSAQPAAIAVVSSCARHRWRRTATNGAGHSQRYISSGAARLGICCLRHHCSSRPYRRADAGRLDY